MPKTNDIIAGLIVIAASVIFYVLAAIIHSMP
jgi:hypothetical protein